MSMHRITRCTQHGMLSYLGHCGSVKNCMATVDKVVVHRDHHQRWVCGDASQP